MAWVAYPQPVCQALDQAVLEGQLHARVEVGDGTVVDLVRMRQEPGGGGGGGGGGWGGGRRALSGGRVD
eukprot:COSAG01_NODE_2799_length_7053_cov_21.482456_3_plen_69_part_00